MKILDKIKYKIQDIISIMISEFSTIATSYAILLVLIGGIFVYGFLYNYMYAPNLIRNAPIAVVDNSRTALSREKKGSNRYYLYTGRF